MLRWLILVSIFCSIKAGEFDFTIEIRPGKYECYFQSVTSEKHKNMEIEYQVIDGGDLNINFMLIHGADVLVQDHMKTDANHKIPLKGLGDYQLCFDNTFSYQARKVVFFEVFLTDSDGNMDDVDLSQFANNDSNFAKRLEEIGITLVEFHAASNRIKNSLNKIEYYQSTLRSFEHRDKVIMAANLSRVSFYSLLTTAVLLIVAVLQVYTIRSLFEENSKLGPMVFKWYALIVVLATLTFHARSQVSTTQRSVTEAADEVILQLIVEPGHIDCIYQPMTKHAAIELDYQVTGGGEMDINFSVKNPRNVQIVYDHKKRDGNHKVEVTDPSNGFGDYAFCFDNSFSMQTKKTIFFEMFLLDKDGNFLNNYDSFNSRDILTPIIGFEKITTKVKGNLNEVERIQTQFRAIEARDRALVEASFERVNFWSVVNLLAVITVLAVQVVTIRSLFIENSKLGRLVRKGRLND
ncbi:hypothetical protein M3Y98_00247300 [Aphelenchoides besseyi]|nr:hypothetical protein M3Y98_00247300 [Aphelenchoides besseyi]KAI6200733.1 hypothetical protein M3Y96_00765500 [Aphelenchoides besseyi]